MKTTSCPHCKRRLLQQAKQGAKIRTSLLLFKGDRVTTICRHCKEEIELDLHPGEQFRQLLFPFEAARRPVVLKNGS